VSNTCSCCQIFFRADGLRQTQSKKEERGEREEGERERTGNDDDCASVSLGRKKNYFGNYLQNLPEMVALEPDFDMLFVEYHGVKMKQLIRFLLIFSN
jgi:hypothetical protein